MSDSLTAVDGLSGSPAWDYRATFARPTLTEKARRSLRKSLTRIFRFNPLGLNPVTPQSTGAITPSRRSFASFLHRFSATSTHHSDFCPFLQDQPISVISPQPPPPLPPPRPSAISGWSREFPQSDTDDSPRPRTIQVPLPALQRPWHHRSSQMTMAYEESKARPFKSVPGWVKFHYPHRSRSGGGVPQESWKTLPPLPISPDLWLEAKVLRRSHSTTASEDEKGQHMASDNGDEPGSKQAVFGRGGRKQVQMGRRISGASADSFVVEKQVAWQI